MLNMLEKIWKRKHKIENTRTRELCDSALRAMSSKKDP